MSETVVERIPVPILYTNWRGETAVRKIVPHTRHPVVSGKPSLWFGSTQWHPEPQWLLTAVDVEKGAVRDWALSGIKAWGEEAVSAALAPTAGAGAWRPMNTAPSDTPIVARHKPNNRTPHGWVATISRAPEDPDERVGGLDTILHYNGDALKRGFHGVWVGWMYPEEFAALALSAGTLSVGWDGARDAFARIVEDRAWTAEYGEPRAACLRAAADIRQAKAPAVPASPRSGAGEGGGMLSTAERQRLGQVAMEAFGDKGFGLDIGRGVFEHAVDRVVSALSQGGGAGRSERSVEIRELSERATQGEWQVGRMGHRHVVDMGQPPEAPYMMLREGAAPTPSFTGWPAGGVCYSDNGSSADNAAFIIALVNAYRSGELFHRSEIAEVSAPAQSPSTSDREG